MTICITLAVNDRKVSDCSVRFFFPQGSKSQRPDLAELAFEGK